MAVMFNIPCEEFLKGYHKYFLLISNGEVKTFLHEGVVCREDGAVAVRFENCDIANYSEYVTPEEWEGKVFKSAADLKEFLLSMRKAVAIKPKFGKWYRCKDVLPKLGEWVLAQPEKGCVYYAKRMSGNQMCTRCLSDSYDWHWVYFAHKCNEEHRMTYFAGNMKYWMPLPTGDEPVEEISN